MSVVNKLFILAILTFGAVIFALPFLDMVFTSVKSDDEIAQEHYHFLPAPRRPAGSARTWRTIRIEPSNSPPRCPRPRGTNWKSRSAMRFAGSSHHVVG